MNKIKQILKSHVEGHGTKQISAKTGIARNTVKQYLRRFKATKLLIEDIERLTDKELSLLLTSPSEPAIDTDRWKVLHPLLPAISKAIRRKGMTITRQWEEYRVQHPGGYQQSQFRKYLLDYMQRKNVTMHFEHKAGDKVFVDYAGKHLYLTEPETGELTPVEVFVAVLGCSQYTFVEASPSQKKEDFIDSCRHMLEFFGGVPKAIVPDNLKSAVKKGSKYAPILNETFENFAEHYNTTVLPTRPRQPKEKSLVEGAVKLIYQRIYIHLDRQIFTSLNELNAAVKLLLQAYNNQALRGEESRLKQFEEMEKNELLSLPDLPYEMRHVKVCTVMKNCHVCLTEDKHYYSVPHQYMGKKVKILYNESTVDIFYKYEKIAAHVRDKRRHKYTTDKEHLAANQQYVAGWSHDYFVKEGNKISTEVGLYMARLMESKAHAEQGFKSCAGILHLTKKVGNERIINACKRAAEYEAYNYPVIEDILRRNLDTSDPKNEEPEPEKATPLHQNIRGKEYYQ
ncbi:MAG: IS21 family transposase [Chitinophagaceae bacterium]